ncbi:MAG: hypothetical protein V1861_02300 [Candidatus Micrarchaeota archaeon]
MVFKLKPSFSFGFSPADMTPIMQMQSIMHNESVLENYFQQSILSESIMKRQKDMDHASVRAQVISEAEPKKGEKNHESEKGSATAYTISYYNPELNKTEVLEGKSEIRISDRATKSVEETVAARSPFSIYGFIAAPLMHTEVVPWKLEEILAEREYGTPPPPPAGAAVTPIKVIVRAEAEIEAEKKKAEAVRAAISEFVLRKEQSELKIAEELLVLEDVISALRSGEDIDKVIERLPPLSRARYLLVKRKKSLGRLALINLLIQDVSFLKTIKKKLELFTLDDLVNIYKVLRSLQKR